MKLVKGIYFPDYDTHFENVIDNEGNYQRKQFDTVMKYIKPEDRGLFIDVGAHVGLWSRMAIKEGFANDVAFEPDEENFECLSNNLSPLVKKVCKILIFHFPLSDEEEDIELKKEKSNNSGAIIINEGQDNATVVFDKFFAYTNAFLAFPLETFKNKTLIKIDVQGYEAKVVRGMTNFIKEYKPIIIVEQWLNGKEDLEATHYCQSFGMKILERVEKEVILGW